MLYHNLATAKSLTNGLIMEKIHSLLLAMLFMAVCSQVALVLAKLVNRFVLLLTNVVSLLLIDFNNQLNKLPKFNFLLLSFTLLLILNSCDSQKNYEHVTVFTFDDFGTPIDLQSENIEFDEPLMKPGRILLVDSILLVQNTNTEFVLHKYNLISRKKCGECIAFGSGPDELLSIKHIQSGDSSIYISDNQRRVVFEYNKRELCLATDPKPRKSIPINEAISSLQHIPGGYVGTTMNPFNKRLLYFNSAGEQTETKGEYPSLEKDFSDIERVDGFQASITFDSINKHLLLFYTQTDLFEIYDLTGKLIKKMHGPDQFFPHVKEISLGDGYSKVSPIYEKSREAYYAPVTVNNEIYVTHG